MNEIIILILKVLFCLVYVSQGWAFGKSFFFFTNSWYELPIKRVEEIGKYFGVFVAMTIIMVKFL